MINVNQRGAYLVQAEKKKIISSDFHGTSAEKRKNRVHPDELVQTQTQHEPARSNRIFMHQQPNFH